MCHQQSLGPCGCPTVPGMSHLAKYLKAPTCRRRPVRGSSFPGSSCWVLPNSTFPLVQLPTLCAGPALSPVQNGDFVSHLVLGTLLGLFLGTGPAGQVCKSMTHTQKLAASASRSCHLPTSHPFLFLLAQGLSPPFSPQVTSKGGTSQEVFICPCHLSGYFLPEEIEALQSSGRLHPPTPNVQRLAHWSSGDSPGGHPAHQDHKDQGLRREGSFSSTCHQGRMQ